MNVLLVDDEDYVLDYLKEAIQWEDYGIEEVYSVSSAEEALDISGRVPVSVMVTDIQMPEKSGLELLREIRHQHPETKVILLSGFSEFEYAKKALQDGAADYLLKPVTGDEVSASLVKVLALIEVENRQRKHLLAAKDVLQLGLTRMREHLLLDMLLGNRYSPDELERQLDTLHLPFAPDQECFLALIRIETGNEAARHEDFELLSYALLNMAEEIFFQQINAVPSLWSCKDSHRLVAIVLPAATFDGNGITGKIETLQQAVHTYMKRTVSILLTRPFVFREDINRQYLLALNTFWRSIGTRNGLLLTMDEASDAAELRPLTRLHQSPTMLQLMETGRWDEVEDRLDQIIEELDSPVCRTQQNLMEVVYYLFSSFSYMAHKQGDSFSDMIGDVSFLDYPIYFHSTAQIKEWALPLMEQFQRTVSEPASGRSHIIRQIHDFIEEHMQEDVSLTRVGEHVYLHPVYLSRLYKKETGESLSSYILRVRMEKAARMLKSTNKKVADIAKEVGYQKTQYFIRLFKEHYNCTPQTFRNN